MGYAKCTVTISNGAPECNPKLVLVRRGTEKGIEWKLKDRRYKFTGVTIEGNKAPTKDFGTPQFSSSLVLRRSVMKVSDSVENLAVYEYTPHVEDDRGQPVQNEDPINLPQIKNQ